jgi:hypothetical protein
LSSWDIVVIFSTHELFSAYIILSLQNVGDFMNQYKIGDIVSRKSYNNDILFKIVDIKQDKAGNSIILKGIDYRLVADAHESDLTLQSKESIKRYA